MPRQPIVFRPDPARASQVRNGVLLSAAGLNPEMPVSSGHLVMAYAAALGNLGIHIGVGEGEVAPDEAMRALNRGLQDTLPYAMKDLAEEVRARVHSR